MPVHKLKVKIFLKCKENIKFTCATECQSFNIFRKIINELSLKYSTKSLKNYHVLKVLYEGLMMIQTESQH